jgi:hypothetical protein
MQYINLLVNQIHKRECDKEGLNLQQVGSSSTC